MWSPSTQREEPLTEKIDPGPYRPVIQQQPPPNTDRLGSFPVYTVSAVIAVKKPPPPRFMVAVAQQKSVQVAYLWLKREI